jgi:hypothetical protein
MTVIIECISWLINVKCIGWLINVKCISWFIKITDNPRAFSLKTRTTNGFNILYENTYGTRRTSSKSSLQASLHLPIKWAPNMQWEQKAGTLIQVKEANCTLNKTLVSRNFNLHMCITVWNVGLLNVTML